MRKQNQNADIVNCQNNLEAVASTVIDLDEQIADVNDYLAVQELIESTGIDADKLTDEQIELCEKIVAEQKANFEFLNNSTAKIKTHERKKAEYKEWEFKVANPTECYKADKENGYDNYIAQFNNMLSFCKMVAYCKLRYMLCNTDENQIKATNKAVAEGRKKPIAKNGELYDIMKQVWKITIKTYLESDKVADKKPEPPRQNSSKIDIAKCYDIAEEVVQECLAEYVYQITEKPIVKSIRGRSVYEGMSFADFENDKEKQFKFMRNRLSRIVRQHFDNNETKLKEAIVGTSLINDEGEEVNIGGQNNTPSAEREALAQMELADILSADYLTPLERATMRALTYGYTVQDIANRTHRSRVRYTQIKLSALAKIQAHDKMTFYRLEKIVEFDVPKSVLSELKTRKKQEKAEAEKAKIKK